MNGYQTLEDAYNAAGSPYWPAFSKGHGYRNGYGYGYLAYPSHVNS